MELARYIVLNPVRAGIVEDAGQWPWSSYGATPSPNWQGRTARRLRFRRRQAVERYIAFVREECDSPKALGHPCMPRFTPREPGVLAGMQQEIAQSGTQTAQLEHRVDRNAPVALGGSDVTKHKRPRGV